MWLAQVQSMVPQYKNLTLSSLKRKSLIENFTCCRQSILYPLQLRLPFPNDGSTLKPKVGLGLNQMKIDLRKLFVENITYFWKNKIIFGKEKLQETLDWGYAYARMRTHTHAMRKHAYGMHTHAQACVRSQVSISYVRKAFCTSFQFGTNPTSSGSRLKPLFFDYIKP